MFIRIFKWIFLICTLILLFNCSSLMYGVEQGYHQLRIVVKAKPVDEFLKDVSYPDSLKYKLRLIGEIRKFAIDSLGLNDTENYQTMYDQKGKPVLWIVTAAPEFEMKQYEWKFPFVGSFPYKGYFKEQKAKDEEKRMKAQGLDTEMGEVEAWSTLGILNDPILSNMLFRTEGNLARVIIHEMTHATIFLKNQGEFNENLASFVGDEGAKLFLKHAFGANSKQIVDYENSISDYEKFCLHLLRGAKLLDSLYKSFPANMPLQEKRSEKKMMIEKIMHDADTIQFSNGVKFSEIA